MHNVVPGVSPVVAPTLVVTGSNGLCTGIANNKIACTSQTTFGVCSNGVQNCPAGLICCTAQNACVFPTSQCNNGFGAYIPPGVAPTVVSSPVPVVPGNLCSGIADGKIACLNSTSFNICQGQVFAGAAAQNCQAGLVCCTATDRCEWPGVCPTAQLSNNLCAGISDGRIACTSDTTYNICAGGVFARAADTTCNAGLHCCTSLNACVADGACPSPFNGLPTVTYTTVTASCTPTPVSTVVVTATSNPYLGACYGIADGHISCLSSTTFNICSNGVFTSAQPQSCPAGTVCCTATNSCVYQGQCPTVTYTVANIFPAATCTATVYAQQVGVKGQTVVYTPTATPYINPCSSTPDNQIYCTSSTSFNICLKGTPVQAASQNCPVGLTNSCSGIPDGHISCTSQNTFNICLQGVFAQAVNQVCNPGLVCCTALNQCVYPGQCPTGNFVAAAPVVPTITQAVYYYTPSPVVTTLPPYPSSCVGVTDNHLSCASSTTFQYCLGGLYVSSNLLSCPTGLVCCGATNACVYPGTCPAVTYTYTPAINAAPTPVLMPTNIPVALAAVTFAPNAYTSLCSGVPNGNIACLSSTTFNTCANGVLSAGVQNCPVGTVCCAATNRCDFPGNCQVVSTNSCAGVANGNIACVTQTTFNICSGGANACVYPGQCPTAPNYVPVPQITVSTVYAPVPVAVTAAPAPIVTVVSNQFPNSCAGIPDNKIACKNATNFNICLGGQYVQAADQRCQPGLECCTSVNECVWPGQCPVITYTVTAYPTATVTPVVAPYYMNISMPWVYQAACYNVPDGHIACLTPTTFNECLNGLIQPGVQNCPSGTVCCASSNRCDWPSSCGVVAGNLCANIPNGHISCTGPTTFNICTGGVFAQAVDQSCVPGTVCCTALNSCVYPGQCPVGPLNTYVPPVMVIPPVATYVAMPAVVATLSPYTSSCAGIMDGHISCKNSTNFNICLGGQYVQAADQPGSCPSYVYTVTPPPIITSTVYVLPSATPTVAVTATATASASASVAPVVVYTPPVSACANMPNGQISCLSAFTYNVCQNGLFALAQNAACPSGTVCCAATNKCDWYGNCPVVYGNLCYNIPNGAISCTSSTTFNICAGGVFAFAVDMSCLPGTVCCTASNNCVLPGQCNFGTTVTTVPTATVTVATTVLTVTSLVTATATINPYANACYGIPTGWISCMDATKYSVCINGQYSALVQSCPSGTTCCTAGNGCVPTGQCPVNTYTYTAATVLTITTVTPITVIPTPTPSVVIATYVPPVSACSGIPDGHISCLNSTTFNICQGGVFAQAAVQTCQPGLFCCTATNKCDYPGNCPVIVTNTCNGVANGQIACTSASTFNICVGGVFASTINYACTPGVPVFPVNHLVERSEAEDEEEALSDEDGRLKKRQFIVTVTQTAYQTPVIYYATVTQPVGLPVLVTQNPYPNSCAGIPDGRISCVNGTTFNICQNGNYVQAAYQHCPGGTVCCTSANQCLYAGQCPVVSYTQTVPINTVISTYTSYTYGFATITPAVYSPPPSICSGIPDGHISCLTSTTFNICQKGVFASANAQTCQPGTICCTATNSCVWPGSCPSVVQNSCSGVANNAIVCTSVNTFNICTNGVFASTVSLACQPGLVCCGALNQCVYPGQCPGGGYTYTPITAAPTYYVTVTPTPTYVTPSNVVLVTATVNPFPNSCAGVPDGRITCIDAGDHDLFAYCFNGCLQLLVDGSACDYNYDCDDVICYIRLNDLGEDTDNNNVITTTTTSVVPSVVTVFVQVASTPFVIPQSPCYGVPDNHIYCLSATQYDVCLSGSLTTATGTCPLGTVCCAATNSCAWPGYCPVVTANLCAGVPNNQIACTSSNTFNICTNGVFASTISQTCQPGLVCCSILNQCVYPGQCPTGLYTTPYAIASPVVPLNPAPAVVVTANPYPNACTGITNGHIACITSTTFNICQNGVFASTSAQTCPAGTVCCTALNECVYAGQCPTVTYTVTPPAATFTVTIMKEKRQVATPTPYGSCYGIPDGHISCLSATSFNICEYGAFARAPPQNCPAGTVCCTATNKCDWPGNCPVVTSNACYNIPDGHIACTSSTTFNICTGGVFANALNQNCLPGLQCCTATNQCVYPGQCPTGGYVYTTTIAPPAIYYTPVTTYVAPVQVTVTSTPYPNNCLGVPDGTVTCRNGTNYNLCVGGQFAIAADAVCPSGTSCCNAARGCVVGNSCNAVTYTYPQVIATYTPNPIPTYTATPSMCSGVPDNHISCLSATTFNICLAGQFAQAAPQSCPVGTLCCAATNSCNWPGSCPVLVGSLCSGIPDNHISCTVFANALDQSCVPGTVCCTALNQCVWPGQCPTGTFTTPAVLAQATVTFASTPTVVALNPFPNSCVGIMDGHISCINATSFNICQGGVYAQAAPQTCQGSLTCCTSSNSCVYPGQCPTNYYTVSAPITTYYVTTIQPTATPVPTVVTGNGCAGVPDNRIYCYDSTRFNVCLGVFSYPTDFTCSPGTVCCAATNSCVFPGLCPSGLYTYTQTLQQIVTVAPTPTLVPVIATINPYPNSCVGITDGHIACKNATNFNVCQGGVYAQAADQCVYAGQCPVTTYTATLYNPAPSSIPAPISVYAPVASSCGGIPNNYISCVNATAFNICNNGVFQANGVQSCPAGPFVTPAPIASPVVTYAYAPLVTTLSLYPNSCTGIADNHIACKNATNFNICSGGLYVNAADQICPAGTTCCTSSNACVYPGQCPAYTYTLY
ncbi:hypothetical protein HK101_004606 [Irineochytrium annulatum]|nr:hypothetical protein HK101_004606 [Irineochytrium annulatum]